MAAPLVPIAVLHPIGFTQVLVAGTVAMAAGFARLVADSYSTRREAIQLELGTEPRRISRLLARREAVERARGLLQLLPTFLLLALPFEVLAAVMVIAHRASSR